MIEDSICTAGNRLTTLQLRYPRFIHAEFMTHRVFSRNASSSRAIPVAKMIEQVRQDPAMPIHWGKNQPGMQAHEECSMPITLELPTQHDNPSDVPLFTFDPVEVSAEGAWREAARQAAGIAEAMMRAGYHKQVANRLLEPFQFMNVVVSATEWENFFELRDHADAEPNIRELAVVMKMAFAQSTPVKRYAVGDVDGWHLPYVLERERKLFRLEALLAISAARCARVSYNKHDGTDPDPEEDMTLFDRLVGSTPLHASPVEHQARAMDRSNWSGNFLGWHQHRKDVEKRAARAAKSVLA